MTKTDLDNEIKHKRYVDNLKLMKCPNCSNSLEVTEKCTYDRADNLISIADLVCKKCYYSTMITERYQEIIK